MGFVAFRKILKKILANQRERLRERETDREIDDDENVIWRNIDANCLLDIKDKY